MATNETMILTIVEELERDRFCQKFSPELVEFLIDWYGEYPFADDYKKSALYLDILGDAQEFFAGRLDATIFARRRQSLERKIKHSYEKLNEMLYELECAHRDRIYEADSLCARVAELERLLRVHGIAIPENEGVLAFR